MNCRVVFVLAAAVVFSCWQVDGRALQLVEPLDGHTTLGVVESNAELLAERLAGDDSDEAVFVAVVGPYHSGKSFLLNQLLGGGAGGAFRVGPSVAPTTMGVWIWDEPLRVTTADGRQRSIYFLDTEGFFGRNVTEVYDARVFAVSALLSSVLLYNTVKTIDQAAIEYVELLARRTQLFQLRSEIVQPAASAGFGQLPHFVWVVEDFFQDLDGQTPTQWLLSLIESVKRDPATQDVSLRQIFPTIECRTLFLPHTARDKLRNLDAVPREELTADFVRELDELRGAIAALPGQRPHAARAFVPLLRTLIEALNHPAAIFPSVPSLWSSFLRAQSAQALDLAKKLFARTVASDQRQLPAALDERIRAASAAAVRAVQTMLFDRAEIYGAVQSQLVEQLADLAAQARDKNVRLAVQAAQLLRVQLFHAYRDAADAAADTEQAPRNEAELAATLERAAADALPQFDAAFAAFYVVDEVRTVKDDLVKDVLLDKQTRERDNRAALDARRVDVAARLVRQYSAALGAESFSTPVSRRQFDEMDSAVRAPVVRELDAELGPLLRADAFADTQRAFAHDLDAVRARVWAVNLEQLDAVFADYWADFSRRRWDKDVVEELPMPRSQLDRRMQQLAQHDAHAFDAQFGGYADVGELYARQQLRLSREIERMKTTLVEQNTRKVRLFPVDSPVNPPAWLADNDVDSAPCLRCAPLPPARWVARLLVPATLFTLVVTAASVTAYWLLCARLSTT